MNGWMAAADQVGPRWSWDGPLDGGELAAGGLNWMDVLELSLVDGCCGLHIDGRQR